ncbi:MAG: hypothetical protein H6767_03220 [Candidatus Peribacteria bacterium]|nr:MAG: hypothetical protein H6767_03220 [Candidatus Peribacteria bacterium]
MKQAKTLAEVIVLAQKQKEAMIDNSDIEDEISGTIIAQDEVGMLFLREQMQNARDAILRAVKR